MTANTIIETFAQSRSVRHEDGVSFRCGRCGEVKPVNVGGVSTGYGWEAISPDSKPICFECCGHLDRERMAGTGRATLYLDDGWVTNWPGTLKLRVRSARTGKHNLAGKRVDVWFTDEAGARWHGVQYGRWTQICHCKRLKSPPRG